MIQKYVQHCLRLELKKVFKKFFETHYPLKTPFKRKNKKERVQ